MTSKTLVEQLVAIDSPSGSEGAVAECLMAQMQARGLNVHQDQVGNVVGTVGDGPLSVYLVGHMDTVPGRIPVRVEDNVLYGRGSVDAKGCLAAFVEAGANCTGAEALTMRVIGCVDEEASSQGAQHLIKTHSPPDCVIIGEPSGWGAITLGYKGSLNVHYGLQKARTHRGAEESTPSEDAVAFYNALCALYPDRGAGFDALSLNLTSINARNADNDEQVDLHLNVRTPLRFDAGAFVEKVCSLDERATIICSQPIPAVLGDKRNGLVRAFLGALRACEATPKFKRKTGTSDMNLLAAWGCPIVAYGPGDSALDHTPNEHLDLGEYERAIKVLKQVLKRLGTSAA